MSKLLNKIKDFSPGIFLCFLIILISIYIAELLGLVLIKLNILSEGSQTPISSIFVAIIIGIFLKNTIGINKMFSKGISFSMKYILRAGIILLGLRLSLIEALKLGAIGIPLISICIFSGLILTLLLAKKMNQSLRLGALIASGTSICGVTAIMAVAPVIRAKENEISYAVANITIFGLTGMLLYPFLSSVLFNLDPIKSGLFLGTAIHDTAQVTGAALIFEQIFRTDSIVEVATVTKLTRNLFIIIIIPLISFLFYKKFNDKKLNVQKSLPKWYQFIPLFVIGFLFLTFIRTLGDITLEQSGVAFGLMNQITWENIYSNGSNFGTKYFLGMAMAGVGLSTDFRQFKGIGIKPFYIGFIAAMFIGLISVILILLFGRMTLS